MASVSEGLLRPCNESENITFSRQGKLDKSISISGNDLSTVINGRGWLKFYLKISDENIAGPCSLSVVGNKSKKCVPLRAMKTFIRKKMGHTT